MWYEAEEAPCTAVPLDSRPIEPRVLGAVRGCRRECAPLRRSVGHGHAVGEAGYSFGLKNQGRAGRCSVRSVRCLIHLAHVRGAACTMAPACSQSQGKQAWGGAAVMTRVGGGGGGGEGEGRPVVSGLPPALVLQPFCTRSALCDRAPDAPLTAPHFSACRRGPAVVPLLFCVCMAAEACACVRMSCFVPCPSPCSSLVGTHDPRVEHGVGRVYSKPSSPRIVSHPAGDDLTAPSPSTGGLPHKVTHRPLQLGQNQFTRRCSGGLGVALAPVRCWRRRWPQCRRCPVVVPRLPTDSFTWDGTVFRLHTGAPALDHPQQRQHFRQGSWSVSCVPIAWVMLASLLTFAAQVMRQQPSALRLVVGHHGLSQCGSVALCAAALTLLGRPRVPRDTEDNSL